MGDYVVNQAAVGCRFKLTGGRVVFELRHYKFFRIICFNLFNMHIPHLISAAVIKDLPNHLIVLHAVPPLQLIYISANLTES